ncbi:hypothetical protein GY45DRAFT_911251 [Cubamyces sp. BRFM 1775]|nr:hypothetical protein GY45DRAFT_911251 [Cubamyces sp. BRFM 1775]
MRRRTRYASILFMNDPSLDRPALCRRTRKACPSVRPFYECRTDSQLQTLDWFQTCPFSRFLDPRAAPVHPVSQTSPDRYIVRSGSLEDPAPARVQSLAARFQPYFSGRLLSDRTTERSNASPDLVVRACVRLTPFARAGASHAARVRYRLPSARTVRPVEVCMCTVQPQKTHDTYGFSAENRSPP